ncbi:MAG: phosphatase PAP2 family protein, partial [Clostridia bacterium]|nr:phosphatase PAP2 family protein [Clostridia bacterium]
VGLFGGLARWNKSLVLRIICIALCVLVPLSRMYLGVHTPADVAVSVCIALVLIFVAHPLFKKAEHSPKVMYAILFSLAALMLSYLCFITLWKFPESVYASENIHNLQSAQKNGFTLTGCIFGLILVYTVDRKWIKFDTKAVWWVQIIKATGGLLLVLAAKELLRLPLNAILPADTWARMIRYFLMVIVGGILWPMTFKYLSRLSKKSTEVK